MKTMTITAANKLGRNFLGNLCLTLLLGVSFACSAALAADDLGAAKLFDPDKDYPISGTMVRYAEQIGGTTNFRIGNFKNAWYLIKGNTPKFYPNNDGWVQVGDTVIALSAEATSGQTEGAPVWTESGVYLGGDIVKKEATCYEAKWWTKGDDPAAEPAPPWKPISSCPGGQTVVIAAIIPANEEDTHTEASAAQTETTADVVFDDKAGETPADETPAGETPADETPTDETPTDEAPAGDAANDQNLEKMPVWSQDGVYLGGSVVQHSVDNAPYCFKANWWTQGNEPKLASALKNPWDSPWAQLKSCPAKAVVAQGVSSGGGATSSGADKLPAEETTATVSVTTKMDTDDDKKATEEAADKIKNKLTPVIPPVTPKEPPKTKAVTTAAPVSLPATGYEFLRLVTDDDWNWLFPMRSGRPVAATDGGGLRNLPPVAKADGSTDKFTLAAFVKAVLEYNNWAQANGFKQFLNEGTLKQQAQEFLVFWAKSSRETSGSWANAPSPWIESIPFSGGETMDVWKGALYWVEEVGFSTDSTTGKSKAVSYVEKSPAVAKAFPPAPGRSYYGRGIIQLSWNYNYGAFSYWMYDNGLFPDIITERDRLLRFPNLVAEKGDLSILSGIWFWMTPQGAKPSSHDVLYGDVYNISSSTQDRGLPQTNDGTTPPTAPGDTNDPAVFAYRIGAIINIVNGGLECNKAAKWHGGPPQRVSYYNAYAAYFNDTHNVGATRIPQATNVWDAQIEKPGTKYADPHYNLKSATCYNQKSYYGW